MPEVLLSRPARSSEAVSDQQIDDCALAAVKKLAADHQGDPRDLPSAPTVACWLMLPSVLGRSPTPVERARFRHRWANAMTCAWEGWWRNEDR